MPEHEWMNDLTYRIIYILKANLVFHSLLTYMHRLYSIVFLMSEVLNELVCQLFLQTKYPKSSKLLQQKASTNATFRIRFFFSRINTYHKKFIKIESSLFVFTQFISVNSWFELPLASSC